MKKQSVLNLIKYHMDKNDEAFATEAMSVARDFLSIGDNAIADYIMELVSSTNVYVPQGDYTKLRFLTEIPVSAKPLFLPDVIQNDLFGIIYAVNRHSGLSKFLFYGAPGTGKTESANQIARLLGRKLLSVNFEQIIDSRLGETARNVASLFEEINCLSYTDVVVFFDELDALVLDRVNANDIREMGRVTSAFLKQLDNMNKKVLLIAATNLANNFDKALVRRFDAKISFDRYSKDDLVAIADAMLTAALKKSANTKSNKRLFNKILSNVSNLPNPGELKQIINTSVAFSDVAESYDYLRRIFVALNCPESCADISALKDKGYTTREIEILSKIPKSSVSRKLKGIENNE